MTHQVNLRRLLQLSTALTTITLAVSLQTSHVLANPKDGQVVGGQATISNPNSTTLHIHQKSDKAIINWKNFDISAGETTQFFQPSNTSVTLNRVIRSQNPTKIMGNLKSNGTIFIVNPDGILFGKGSRIDVGGLVATTHDITNKDFIAGRYHFGIPGNPKASIVNLGNINIADHGIGAFVAPAVRNAGVITARLGKVGLSAANKFTLDMYGDDLIHLELTDALTGEVIDLETGKPVKDLVKNGGKISANGGTVALTAATARKVVNSVINNTGVIEANTIGLRNGKIILGAQTAKTKRPNAPKQIVKVSGTLRVKGKRRGEKGGLIAVTGEHIDSITAYYIATGWSGGGRILIGGDYMGGKGDPDTVKQYNIPLEENPVPTATSVNLGEGVVINADATNNGKGGKVIVWSDYATAIQAIITARGGKNGGDGGFIETSGKQFLSVTKAADASAKNGKAGTWLLDPENVEIKNTINGTVETQTTSYINPSVIEASLNSGTNVQISASELISVQSSITKSSGADAVLSLVSGGSIYVHKAIKSAFGKLNITLDATDTISASSLFTNGGNIDIRANSFFYSRNLETFILGAGNEAESGSLTATVTDRFINNGRTDITANINTRNGDVTINAGNLFRLAGSLNNYIGDIIGNNISITAPTINSGQSFLYAKGDVTIHGTKFDLNVHSDDLTGSNELKIIIDGGARGDSFESNVGIGKPIRSNGAFGSLKFLIGDSFNADEVHVTTSGLDSGSYRNPTFGNTSFYIRPNGYHFLDEFPTSHTIYNQFMPITFDANNLGVFVEESARAYDIKGNVYFTNVASVNGNIDFGTDVFTLNESGEVYLNGHLMKGPVVANLNPPTVNNGVSNVSVVNDGTWTGFTSANTVFTDNGGVNNLTLTATGLPSGITFVANGNGTFSFSASSNSSGSLPAGSHIVTVTATDQSGASVTTQVTLVIAAAPVTPPPPTPVNQSPSIGAGGIGSIAITNDGTWSGYTSSNTVFSDDGGINNLVLTATGLPNGVTFSDNSNGTFSFGGTSSAAGALTAGNNTITITATDQSGATVTTQVVLVIATAPVAPPTPVDPTSNTPQPVVGVSIPSGSYVVGEQFDILLPPLFTVDTGTIAQLLVFGPSGGNFQLITVNGQTRLVGTYSGNPGAINLTFEATSNSQQAVQLILPITFSAVITMPTPESELPIDTIPVTPEAPVVGEDKTAGQAIDNPEKQLSLLYEVLSEDALLKVLDSVAAQTTMSIADEVFDVAEKYFFRGGARFLKWDKYLGRYMKDMLTRKVKKRLLSNVLKRLARKQVTLGGAAKFGTSIILSMFLDEVENYALDRAAKDPNFKPIYAGVGKKEALKVTLKLARMSLASAISGNLAGAVVEGVSWITSDATELVKLSRNFYNEGGLRSLDKNSEGIVILQEKVLDALKDGTWNGKKIRDKRKFEEEAQSYLQKSTKMLLEIHELKNDWRGNTVEAVGNWFDHISKVAGGTAFWVLN